MNSNNMDKKTFVFFPSFLETIEKIPDLENRNIFMNAIIEYGVNGVDPQLQFPYDALFTPIKVSIDKSQNRYKTALNNGKKGGRPRKEKPELKPEPKPELKPEPKPEKNQTESSNKDIRLYGNKDIRLYGNKDIIPESTPTYLDKPVEGIDEILKEKGLV